VFLIGIVINNASALLLFGLDRMDMAGHAQESLGSTKPMP
jgi:hypothetical protein